MAGRSKEVIGISVPFKMYGGVNNGFMKLTSLLIEQRWYEALTEHTAHVHELTDHPSLLNNRTAYCVSITVFGTQCLINSCVNISTIGVSERISQEGEFYVIVAAYYRFTPESCSRTRVCPLRGYIYVLPRFLS